MSDPGNMGTIIRTAAAVGCSTIITTKGIQLQHIYCCCWLQYHHHNQRYSITTYILLLLAAVPSSQPKVFNYNIYTAAVGCSTIITTKGIQLQHIYCCCWLQYHHHNQRYSITTYILLLLAAVPSSQPKVFNYNIFVKNRLKTTAPNRFSGCSVPALQS